MNAGDKFELSFENDDESRDLSDVPAVSSFVGDVLERQTATTSLPAAPTLKNKTGFPIHTKRAVQSRFKQNREDVSSQSKAGAAVRSTGAAPDDGHENGALTEREQIDQENRDRLASMSIDEIEEARRELLGAMDPALLQRILQRADIGSGSNEAADLRQVETSASPEEAAPERAQSRKKVAFVVDEHSDTEPAQPELPPQDSIHFPRAPQPPDLDPNSDTFFEDLHSKYFPSLPAEPDKLEWMRASKSKNTYDPSQSAVNPRDIRFDFTGALLAPSDASQIPVSAGLHHHADAPEAAGYTIPELAHLSRSTYAPQRCIAFQTLGRILYKLGKGVFGDPGEPGANTVGVEDTLGELARGLWREIETQHVIEQLVAESEGNGIDGGRHISAKSYATEAVWLWRQGGGRRWKAD